MNQSITGTRLVECLGEGLDYSDAMTSFSPFYSDIDLGLDDASGIRHLYLHYNRCTTGLGEPFLALPPALQASRRTATGVEQRFEAGVARIAFCDINTWVLDCDGVKSVEFDFAAICIRLHQEL